MDLNLDRDERSKPTQLYPPIGIKAPSALTDDESFHISSIREISHRMQNSHSYLVRKEKEIDIKRYSDRHKSSKESKDLISELYPATIDVKKYVPEELVQMNHFRKPGITRQPLGGAYKSSRVGVNEGKATDLNGLSLLEQQESELNVGVDTIARERKDGAEDDDDVEINEGEENDEFEMDDDYGVDHYASDEGGISDGGDGGDREEGIY